MEEMSEIKLFCSLTHHHRWSIMHTVRHSREKIMSSALLKDIKNDNKTKQQKTQITQTEVCALGIRNTGEVADAT